MYLSPIIDCFDGLVISWSIGTRPDAELVNTMLDAAVDTVANSNDRPVVHSDRGAHYRWPGWLSRIENAKLTRSMSRKGCSPDNAACEGFFGRLKTEMFYLRDGAALIDSVVGAPPVILAPGFPPLVREDLTPAPLALAECLGDVAARLAPDDRPRYLTARQEYDLTHWDAEIYRQTLPGAE